MRVHAECRTRPTDTDIRRVVTYLNDDDKDELLVTSALTPYEVLMKSRELSSLHGYYEDGKCKALFGVAPLSRGFAAPWMVSTSDVEIKRNYLRLGRWFIRLWLKKYETLFNFVSEKHSRARRYLAHLGFKFTGEFVLGTDNKTKLLAFSMKREKKVCANP